LRHIGFELHEVAGLSYNPLTRKASISSNTSVNYLMVAEKPHV
jgi:2-polyprenyl-6-hydroxyphenyl methylase / 3-demethylubiquinone-9 3-methyltransferase